MAKNTSKKIKELKGIKPEKITDEQLKKVQAVINDINKFQLEIGILETKKHNFLHHISQSQEQIGEMQIEFEKEYGTSDINIQDGTIKYPENVEADKKD
jgi:FtsZ-binding cell division protein ZapB